MLLLCLAIFAAPAFADNRTSRDHTGDGEQQTARYSKLRQKSDRAANGGFVLERVPMAQTCVTPRAGLDSHHLGENPPLITGVKVTSTAAKGELASVYPPSVQEWIEQRGPLAAEGKHRKNGIQAWSILDPCPEEF